MTVRSSGFLSHFPSEPPGGSMRISTLSKEDEREVETSRSQVRLMVDFELNTEYAMRLLLYVRSSGYDKIKNPTK